MIIEDASFLQISLSGLVGTLVNVILVIIVILAILLVRQVSLMNRVVSVPVNGWFKVLAWGYLLIAVTATAIVVLI